MDTKINHMIAKDNDYTNHVLAETSALSLAAMTTVLFGFRVKDNVSSTIWSRDRRSKKNQISKMIMTSVTRLGDILDFGELFKAFGDN